MEEKPKRSRKLLGIVLSIMVALAGGILYFALLPTVPQIEVTNISCEWLPVIGHEWMPPMELRVRASVKSMETSDYEIDLKFEVIQEGEEIQVKTSTFVVEAMQEQEFVVYIGFLNPEKELECTAQIVAQRKVSL